MQVTYTLPVDSLDEVFIENSKSRFAGRVVKIVRLTFDLIIMTLNEFKNFLI